MIQNDDLEILYSPFHYISTLAPDEKDLVQQYSNKFGEQNRYQPGVYLVKFNDSETIQYLDEFFIDQISSSEYFKVMDGKTKKMK